MEEIRQIPFLRLLLPLLAGIIASLFFGLHVPYISIVCFAAFLTQFLLINKFQSYNQRWGFGLVVYIALFSLGLLITEVNTYQSQPVFREGEKIIASAEVEKISITSAGNVKLILDVNLDKRHSDFLASSNSKIITTSHNDSVISLLSAGDLIAFEAIVRNIPGPSNPHDFNYRNYMLLKGISQQAIIVTGKWKLLSKRNGENLFTIAEKCRNYLLDIFKKAGLRGNEFAVASALTIGYADEIDQNVKQAFSATGATHILSVSGLHVGIIYVVFRFLFSFLEKIKNGRIIQAVIIVVLLWFYALITGMSAAVLRATAMFSMLVVGQSLSRPVNIYNTLSAAAFVLLIINPMNIADIGFQLSFIAVVGIVFFHPLIYKLFYSRFWIVDKIWGLISVSIAAQLVSFPLCIYYFNQFPNYFLLTNIIVIPLSTVVLYCGIALFCFSFFDTGMLIIGKLLSGTVSILNETVFFIESLPYSVSSGLTLNLQQMILVYGLILFSAFYVVQKKLFHIKAVLVITVFLLATFIVDELVHSKRETFLVFKSKEFCAEFISGNKAYVFGSSDSRTLSNHNQKEDISSSIVLNDKFEDSTVFCDGNFVQFAGKRYVFLNSNALMEKTTKKISVDYAVITENISGFNPESLDNFNIRTLIVAIKNTKLKLILNSYCKSKNITLFNIADQGAYVVEMS